jgi:predicted Zn-dependent protease
MQKTFFAIFACILILLVGYAAYNGYSKAKEARLMGMARSFMAQNDTRNAVLSLAELLQKHPGNIEANRMMADLAENDSPSNALAWRLRVVQLAPNSAPDRIALASAAMLMGDLSLATNSLDQVSPAARNSAAYQNTAGVLAIATHQPLLAEADFKAAATLDPASSEPQMNYAILRLRSTNVQAAAEARTTLEKFAQSGLPQIRCQALRELEADAFVHDRVSAALDWSHRLLAETNSVFSDRLVQLEIVKRSNVAQLPPELAAAQAAANGDPVRILQLADWEMDNVSPQTALNWMQTLPAIIRTNQPVAMLSAQCQAITGDWAGLDQTLGKQQWGKLDFVRHAFLARSLRGRQLPDGATAEWNKACGAAGTDIRNLTTLYGMAHQWSWTEEGNDLLWTIVRNHPQEKWATLALTQSLAATGRTQSLMLLFNLQVSQDPADLDARNNLAMTALLLGAKEQKPFELAQSVYEADPQNASFASTYALSLYLSHKNVDALKVLQKLPAGTLKTPEIAGYYGMMLKANGDQVQGGAYLKLAANARLLPEERKLFAAAQ